MNTHRLASASLHSTPRAALLAPALLTLLAGQLVILWLTFVERLPVEAPAALAARPTLFLAGQIVGLLAVLTLLWRVALITRYRPAASVSDDELPEITVIVPAYNEGRQVYETLRSLVRSDYPRRKLRIVAINDGSKDDTWRWIHRGARELSEQVVALNCRVNRGKRAALYEGFARARGEVIVTVDSDSEVLPDTLRNLVSPFVRDPRIGAVAGNVRVLNREAGVIPAMLDVTFTSSFEFMRASESRVDTVMCCPGALAAYRRDVVEDCKDEWLAQTFLGRPANIGEDRAMTNLILRRGYLSRFQSSAIVLTEVPTTTAQLARMFLRWARSNVRETIVLARFIFTRFRPGPARGARVNLIWAAARLLLAPLLLLAIPIAVADPSLGAWVLAAAVLSAALPATIFACVRSLRGALWALPYGLYSLLCLSWITPYALFTAHRARWLTRDLPAPLEMSGRGEPRESTLG